MVESPKLSLSYQEADAARDKYVEASEAWYRRIFMPHIATALELVDENEYGVVLLLEKERHEKRALKLAKKCIADVPVSVQTIGLTELVD